jgi:transcriptional regulator with XRE-family HTH domain
MAHRRAGRGATMRNLACVTWTPEDWQRLGHALRAERGKRGRKAVEALSGVSARMILDYENGKVHERPPGGLVQLAKFYGWTFDSVTKVLDNTAMPAYRPDAEHQPSSELRELLAAVDLAADRLSERELRLLAERIQKHTER